MWKKIINSRTIATLLIIISILFILITATKRKNMNDYYINVLIYNGDVNGIIYYVENLNAEKITDEDIMHINTNKTEKPLYIIKFNNNKKENEYEKLISDFTLYTIILNDNTVKMVVRVSDIPFWYIVKTNKKLEALK